MPENLAHVVPNNLHRYRVKEGWSQRDLANASGVAQVTISFIETGRSEPIDLIKGKLANALGVPIHLLFPDAKEWTPLRRRRVKNRLTQRELAKMAKLNPAVISLAENGEKITENNKAKLARALGTTPGRLFPKKKIA